MRLPIEMCLGVMLPCYPLQPLPPPPPASHFVTCHLMGGVGNQLFQVATTLAYAWDNQVRCYFPSLNSNEYNLTYSRNKILFRLDNSDPPCPVLNFFEEACWHAPQEIPFRPAQNLYGYFQSWRYFHRYRDRLLQLFAPSDEVTGYLQYKYGELIADPQTVSIHVRTFNARLHNEQLHPFLGIQYYQKAIDLFPKSSTFVVFSDRIHWCKTHFSRLYPESQGWKFVYIEDEAVNDLFLMAQMKHNILANSTFSWWSAYLNENPEKTVVAPRDWMHPDTYEFPKENPNDFYLPEWKIVSPNFNEPYPIDITWYGDPNSLDGNG